MGAPHVFSEKFRRPTHVGLRRERLESALLADDGPGLALVCAPAGSGKSTLLATVADASDIPTAWYRVTADESSSAAFVKHLAAGLGRCMELPVADTIDDLLAALDAAATQPCLLVLDDVHEILGSPAEQALQTFLDLRPRSVQVAIGTRRQPDINLPRLRAAGEITEVSSDDLRFRVWEVEELFTIVHRAPLSPERAAALTRRTGGWAAGLQMFHLATSAMSSPARQQAVDALGPRTRLIRSYLARNVLGELDSDRRRFLIDTCALGLLTGQLCDDLLGTTDSADVLDALERDQLFTASVDDGVSFRYHEVLQRHLELALVADRGAEGARRWYARCAELLEAAGAHRDALRAFALAEDWRSVARLVRRNSADVTSAIAAEPDGLLPAALLRDDPWLALADARRGLRRGAIAHAIAAFRHAETLLDEPHFRDTCVAERLAASAWLPDRPTPEVGGWTERVRALTRGSARGLTTLADVTPEGTLVRAVEALLAADFALASSRFADVAMATPDGSLPRLCAALGAVVANLAAGRADDSAQRLEEIALDAALGGYPWIERMCRGVLAAWLAVSSGAAWRLEACSELMAECERDGDRWGAALLQLGAAVAARLVGDPAAARRFESASARFQSLDAPVLAAWGTRAARLVPSPAKEMPQPLVADVRLRCFGGFEITLDGAPIELGELRPRAQALLHVLALEHGRSVHRERLIDTLWPGAPVSAGARRLQVAISSIRTVLQTALPSGADVIRRTGDSYRLVLPDAAVDVHDFDQLLAEAAVEPDTQRRMVARRAAMERYTGELLPEDGSADHVVGERERLRLAAATASCALARDHVSAGEFAEAAATARRSLELDRYQDSAWHLLVEALTAAGDQSAALRAEQEHVHVRAELEDDSVAQTSYSTSRAAVERSLSAR